MRIEKDRHEMGSREPEWVAQMVAWIREHASSATDVSTRQGSLWTAATYHEEAPSIRIEAEFQGAVEHLEYSIFRRYHNHLTRAERARLDNTIHNALYKIERYLERLDGPELVQAEAMFAPIRDSARTGRERLERQQQQARRADLKLAQLADLTPDAFEEFIAELFEALEYEVERVGGSGDEGADLLVCRERQRGVVQCKYSKSNKGVIGSPDLQKFLGTIHHTQCHKGFFVTTRSFTLAAERFATEHPIELIDGPRLVDLVHQALGPTGKRSPGLLELI